MKVTGSHVLHASPSQVWDALRDPTVLVRNIPGCDELAEVGDHTYTARVRADVASITGTYEGRVALSDQVPPTSYTLRATGTGAPGTIAATATVRLTEAPGGTQVDYEADAVVDGTVGGVGQRVLAGVAQRNATEFFEGVDRYLAGELDDADEAARGSEPVGEGTAASVSEPEPVPPPGARPAQLMFAALIGAAIALLVVLLGRRTRP